jgi:ribosomal protein S18 acetylase RimI-like enzyme
VTPDGVAGECGWLLREARPGDAEAIARVHVLSWRQAYAGIFSPGALATLDTAERLAVWRSRLAEPGPGQVTVAGIGGTGIAGFAAAGPPRDGDLSDGGYLELYSIYLRPDAWGSGLADRLLDEAVRRALELSPGRPAVSLWVLAANQRARAFYQRHGFSPDGDAAPYELAGERAVKVRYQRALG